MNYATAIIGFIACTALLLAIFTGGPGGRAPVVLPSEEEYSSDMFGLRFVYQDRYVLEERRSGIEGKTQYDLILTERTEGNQRLQEQGRTEGSPAITISVFDNALDELSGKEFINERPESNFSLSPDGVVTPVNVSGELGYWYIWDGLYRGESVVIELDARIYMFSVTYTSSKDQIWTDYRNLLKTVRF